MLAEKDRVEVEVGQPAHGGHCVARHDGQVIFVRHALPGERVVVEVTEVHKGYARADAVEIIEASPDRVTPPCPYSHPDGCGGCDLQHAAPNAQLEWKRAVLREQFQRLARLELDVPVEPLPASGPFGWRTRVRYRVAASGRAGLLKHRSNEVVPIDRCLIAHPSIQALDVLERSWPDVDTIDVVVPSDAPAEIVRNQRIFERAVGRRFELEAGGFWQVHPAAAGTLAGCVLDFLRPRKGERAWDLYGGAGLFSAALAQAGCEVTLVESAAENVEAARRSLSDLPVRVLGTPVENARLTKSIDLVVLDPPRVGAGARVVRMINAAAPRAVAYVACDPAALARDVRTFMDLGWELRQVRAFDCFPQTHHLEAVAHLVRQGVFHAPSEGEGSVSAMTRA
ncbi:MAG TPA: TRAM domain-containing protein [Candidatus Limnocylindrales bacterium]|nr:TRAM domain-containing protein [Candidatus Limnocylindrales bacterium]